MCIGDYAGELYHRHVEQAIARPDAVIGALGLVVGEGRVRDGESREPARRLDHLYAAIDGVDFDGAKVDWADLRSRLRTFGAQEKESLELAHACRMQAAADALEGAAR